MLSKKIFGVNGKKRLKNISLALILNLIDTCCFFLHTLRSKKLSYHLSIQLPNTLLFFEPSRASIQTIDFRNNMNAGRMDNIEKGAIIRNVCQRAGIRNSSMGKIEILREFSFFEIDTVVADQVLQAMKGEKRNTRQK